MKKKFKLLNIAFSVASLILLLMILLVYFAGKNSREEESIKKQQRINIPFKAIKDKYGN